MTLEPQPLHDSGHRRKFPGEGGEDGKPQAMTDPPAHTSKHFFGRSGLLKAGRPAQIGGSGNVPRFSGIASLQKSRRRK